MKPVITCTVLSLKYFKIQEFKMTTMKRDFHSVINVVSSVKI